MDQTGKFYSVKFTFLIAAFLIAISASTITFGGSKDSTAKANTIKTIVMGINSENHGVAKSAINLVGHYGFLWAVDPLIGVLNDSSRETVLRVLAAYSLDMIGDGNAMEAIKNASMYNDNYMVKGTCVFIYNSYLKYRTEIFSIRE